MLVLGLDISTSILGLTLLDTGQPVGQRLVFSTGLNISKVNGFYAKSCVVRCKLEEIKKQYNVDRILVEEPFQSFKHGLSSAKVLATLTRFNGVVTFLAEDIFGKECEMINVNSARKHLDLKIKKKFILSTKDQVLKWVQNHSDFSQYSWPVKTMKSGPRKGTTIYDSSCYDIADSAVIALCFKMNK